MDKRSDEMLQSDSKSARWKIPQKKSVLCTVMDTISMQNQWVLVLIELGLRSCISMSQHPHSSFPAPSFPGENVSGPKTNFYLAVM